MQKNPTLQSFLREVYLPASLNVGPRTARDYQSVVNHMVAWCGRDVRLARLSDEMLCRYLRHLSKNGAAPATVNSHRAKLLALWRCAWRKRLVDELPRDVPKLREPQRVPEAWTVDEVSRLVTHCRELSGKVGPVPKRDFWTSLVLVSWETAQRIGALLQSHRDDFKGGARTLLIRPDTTKTGAGQLYSLSEDAVVAVSAVLHIDNTLIWAWPRGRRCFFAQFRRIVEAAGLQAGKHNDLFHKLRRSNLSYTAANGGIDLARQQAGHDHARTTLKHYVDPRIARPRSARDVLPPLTDKED